VTPSEAPSSGVVLPSHDDPLVRELSGGIGGPVGAYARLQQRRGWWTALRVIIALTVITCTLGWLQKVQCRDVRNWSKGGGVYQYTRVCYSDVVALYSAEHLGDATRNVAYVDHPVEYPVLIGAAMDLTARVAREAPDQGQGADHHTALFYDLTVLLLSFGALVTVICTGLTARRRIWDAAMIALAPTLVLHLGTNWDLLAVAIASGALLAWARRRPVLAGVLMGLATATKLYPALFLLPLLALCLRTGLLRTWVRTAGAALASFVLINMPFWVVSPIFADEPGKDGRHAILGPSPVQALRGGGLGDFVSALWPWRDGGSNGVLRFWHLNRTRGADWDSLWLLLEHVRPARDTPVLGSALQWPLNNPDGGAPGHLNVAVALLVLLGSAGVFALAVRAPRRPRLPQLLLLQLVAFLLVNKVDSPQYTLWLTPLVALALPRWRIFLAWQLSEVVLTVTRFQYFIKLGKEKAGVDYPWFATTVGIRDLLLVTIAAIVVRDVLAPRHDPVRADGLDDDPAGGLLQGQPDRHERRGDGGQPDRHAARPPLVVDA
jgi:uncharacterized membrane protein